MKESRQTLCWVREVLGRHLVATPRAVGVNADRAPASRSELQGVHYVWIVRWLGKLSTKTSAGRHLLIEGDEAIRELAAGLPRSQREQQHRP